VPVAAIFERIEPCFFILIGVSNRTGPTLNSIVLVLLAAAAPSVQLAAADELAADPMDVGSVRGKRFLMGGADQRQRAC
jgi:hypothetical protein